MLRAYHIIGPGNADLARLGQPEYTGDIIARLHETYRVIVSSGVLRPASQHKDGVTRMFALDRLVGDDNYVFLSVGKRYWLSPDAANFGFIFDAECLVTEQGAILRSHDLMADYEDLLNDAVEEFAPSSPSSEWTEKERGELFAALEDPHGTDEQYVSPNDAYYRLLDAVQDQDMTVPFVKEATARLLRQVKALQSKHQYSGQAALEMLADGGQMEMLVPHTLPVSLAIASIQYGKDA